MAVRRLLLLAFCAAIPLAAQPSEAELRRYYEDGEKALADGRYADAGRAYEKLRQLTPGTAEVYAKLGLIYFQEAKFEQAVPVLRQALKLKPGLPKTDVLLAMCLSELGRYREALPALEKAFRGSTDPALKRMSGLHLERAYTGLQRDADAVEVALELSRLYPDDPEVLYHTGRLFGNYAFLSMQKLAEIAPSSLWRHLAAGEAYESAASYDLAIGEYRKVLEIDPQRAGIHLRIGRVLLAARREAAPEFEQELQLDPTNANAAYELGEIRRKAGQLDKARELFELAVTRDPDFEEARVGLGRVLLALDKPGAAVIHLKRATALDPADPVAWYHLAQAHQALGNALEQQKALAEFRRLRADALQRQQSILSARSSREATRQELDSNTP
jgi:tetratricopeptide (TPR) repeat protein